MGRWWLRGLERRLVFNVDVCKGEEEAIGVVVVVVLALAVVMVSFLRWIELFNGDDASCVGVGRLTVPVPLFLVRLLLAVPGVVAR